ncbi:glycosyltransferase family A protein [Nocardia sp. GTS18]|uniref:glycosyltransferase family 2 protein n=1 Tax=Nocardia sp. GTS18 TaxID=1778064 RepID=UPI0015EEE628|nr:glycosyltransferase family A protein [Nocardia sp. GTS18]
MIDRKLGLTVIVPCYNSGNFVLEAVESAVRQPMSFPHEVLVVDDGSDDPDTLASIVACEELPNVRAIRRSDNCGAQGARTAALHYARYPYVLPLDSDDRLATDPDLLAAGSYPERAVQLLASSPNLAFVHTYSQMFGAFHGLTISAYPCREELLVRKHHAPMSIVYGRADALAAGGYDPRVRKWQDWAFAIDLLATRHRRGKPNTIGCIPGPFHEYRVHSRFARLSAAQVDELESVHLVVEKNLAYFHAVLGENRPAAEVAAFVCASKPDRLTDLLHMAAVNLDQALAVARGRVATMSCPTDVLGVP